MTVPEPLATEGDLTVVGNPQPGIGQFGFAEVLRRTGNEWTLEAQLLHSDPTAGRGFAESVAIDSDSIFVSLGDSQVGASDAAILVYTGGPNWAEGERILPPSGSGPYSSFGEQFAVDGNLLAVSCLSGTYANVLIYEFSGSSWAFVFSYVFTIAEAVLPGDAGSLPIVAVSGDNVLIGSAVGSQPNGGQVWTVRRAGGLFDRESSFTHPTPGFLDGFGGALALDGDTAMIGAGGSGLAGEVLFFERNSTGAWDHLRTLSDPTATPGAGLGSHVALSGSRAAAGVPLDSRVAQTAGGVALFEDLGAGFAYSRSLLPTWSGGGDRYGDQVALSGDELVVLSNNEATDVGSSVQTTDRAVLYSFDGLGCPSLIGIPEELAPLPGATHELFIEAGATLGNQVYIVLGSMSGTLPGFNLQGFTIPLNPDAYFAASLTQPNLAPFENSLGKLDPSGRAVARLRVPPLIDVSGLVLDHAAIVVDPVTLSLTHVSEPQRLTLQ